MVQFDGLKAYIYSMILIDVNSIKYILRMIQLRTKILRMISRFLRGFLTLFEDNT